MNIDHHSVQEYELEISSDCNAACPLCARTNYRFSQFGNDNLTLQDIMHIFPDETYIKNKKFMLCGVFGDPIVNPECMEICRYLSDNGASFISLSTNGGYNNVQWWSEIAKIKNVEVDFAVDGHADTNHIYRVNVKWEVVRRNMQAFSDAGGKGTWVYLTFDHNDCEYDIAKEDAKTLGFKFKEHDSARTKLNKISRSVDRKTKKVVSIKNSQTKSNIDLDEIRTVRKLQFSKNIKELEKWKDTIYCKSTNNRMLYISSTGHLFPCCFLHDTHRLRPQQVLTNTYPIDFNNLKLHSIDDVLASKFFINLEDSWNPNHPNHMPRCMSTCAAHGTYSKNRSKKV